MSGISIDVSPEEHRKLNAIAALQGKRMKDYLLEGKIDPAEQDKDLGELGSLLDDRIKHHRESGQKGRSSAKAILEDVLKHS